MAFSATDWRSRLSFYTNGNNYDHSFGYLGNQQGNLKYYTVGTYVGFTGGRLDYWSCAGAGNTPVVEAFNATAGWIINEQGSGEDYNGYYNTFQSFYTEGPYEYGTWYFYTGQSGFSSNTQYVTLPPPGGSSYFFFSPYYSDIYYGASGYSYSLDGTGFTGYNLTPSTFYNYKNGPFLSYYQYSLSSGTSPFTNFPFQTITVGGAC
jgi:hypothetical protein